jgi:cyclic pyranopterin phosphate synthase
LALVDGFGRAHDDLRISVTDRCNLRCAYCMPVDPVWFPRAEILTYEEVTRVARVAMRAGVRKLRLTGGEPLVRRDLPELVRALAELPGLDDLSLTSNGLRLGEMAEDLASAGLRRINVSLDTLDRERYAEMTRRDRLPRVLAGIEAAVEAGLAPIKVNTVLLPGINDDEVESMVEHARTHGWELRFIEFMPLENDDSWDASRVITGDEVRRRIARRWDLEPDPAADPHAPATRYRFRDGCGAVGFINSVSEPFCAACSRLRLTSDGKFRVCLYDENELDLKTPLRAGVDDARLRALMERAVRGKGRGGALEIIESRTRRRPSRTMHQIGG